jgi:hypothetical protein
MISVAWCHTPVLELAPGAPVIWRKWCSLTPVATLHRGFGGMGSCLVLGAI